jgi:hypothetical protein
MEALDTLAWPVGRLGEAIAGLARLRGWRLRSVEAPVCPAGLQQGNPEVLHVWLEAVATWFGVAAEPVEVPYAEVESLVRSAGPALIRLPGREKPGFLALLGSQRRRVMLLGPDLVVHRVSMAVLCTACRHDVEAPLEAEVGHVLDTVGVPTGGTGNRHVTPCWANGSVGHVLRTAGSCVCQRTPHSGSR